jgi:hypothetical protein
LSISSDYPHFDSAHFDSTHFYVWLTPTQELIFVLGSAINSITHITILLSVCKLILMLVAKMLVKAREAVIKREEQGRVE